MPKKVAKKSSAAPYEGAISKFLDMCQDYINIDNIKKRTDAKAYKKRELAKAKRDAKIISAEGSVLAKQIKSSKKQHIVVPDDLLARTLNRLRHEEVQKQINLEAITLKAITYLPKDADSEPVNNDWKTRFFSIASEISDEDMQEIWAKILAGEVAKPGTYSLRTMNILQNMTQDEALIFQKISSLCFHNGVILRTRDTGLGLGGFGIKYAEVLRLRDAGLLIASDELVISYKTSDNEDMIVMASYDNKYKIGITPKDKNVGFEFPCIGLSVAGIELMKLVSGTANIEYFKWVHEVILAKHPNVQNIDCSDRQKVH